MTNLGGYTAELYLRLIRPSPLPSLAALFVQKTAALAQELVGKGLLSLVTVTTLCAEPVLLTLLRCLL